MDRTRFKIFSGWVRNGSDWILIQNMHQGLFKKFYQRIFFFGVWFSFNVYFLNGLFCSFILFYAEQRNIRVLYFNCGSHKLVIRRKAFEEGYEVWKGNGNWTWEFEVWLLIFLRHPWTQGRGSVTPFSRGARFPIEQTDSHPTCIVFARKTSLSSFRRPEKGLGPEKRARRISKEIGLLHGRFYVVFAGL